MLTSCFLSNASAKLLQSTPRVALAGSWCVYGAHEVQCAQLCSLCRAASQPHAKSLCKYNYVGI
jgi:hypothetical protein